MTPPLRAWFHRAIAAESPTRALSSYSPSPSLPNPQEMNTALIGSPTYPPPSPYPPPQEMNIALVHLMDDGVEAIFTYPPTPPLQEMNIALVHLMDDGVEAGSRAPVDNERLRHTFLVYYSRMRRAFNRCGGEVSALCVIEGSGSFIKFEGFLHCVTFQALCAPRSLNKL